MGRVGAEWWGGSCSISQLPCANPHWGPRPAGRATSSGQAPDVRGGSPQRTHSGPLDRCCFEGCQNCVAAGVGTSSASYTRWAGQLSPLYSQDTLRWPTFQPYLSALAQRYSMTPFS